jgi:hypothetical protein
MEQGYLYHAFGLWRAGEAERVGRKRRSLNVSDRYTFVIPPLNW